jgi:ankyrin repeat protein
MGNRIMVDQANLMMMIMLGDEERLISFIKQQGKMIDLNESINRMGDTLAHYAAYKGYKHLLKYLISNNANMNLHNHVCLLAEVAEDNSQVAGNTRN